MPNAKEARGTSLKTPSADFLVRPEEQGHFWMLDRMHFPDPITPLDFAVTGDCFGKGFTAAVRSYGTPLEGAKVQRLNTYRYWSVVPMVAAPEVLAQKSKGAEEKIGGAMAHLPDLWKGEWLPEMQRHLAFWDGFDLRQASSKHLGRHLDETLDRATEVWELHFRLALPMYIAISQFDEFYREVFGGEGGFNAYALLQGFDNKTLETMRVLWDLSRQAQKHPSLKRAFAERPLQQVAQVLEESPEGQRFLKELKSFLETYGKRSEAISIDAPSWLEDPSPVIKNLKDYIGQPDRDPEHELKALAVERERQVAETQDRLRSYPGVVRETFEFLLKAAQFANALSEEHTFWIDYALPYRIREVSHELGRRFAEEGVLDRAQDVTMLTPEEVCQTAETITDHRALVAARKAEMAHFRTVPPPPFLGTPPPADAPRDPMSIALGKLFGVPTSPSESPNMLKGNPGSPGIARGRVKVVRTLREADKLQHSDVLVAETTSPSWTPLFATVGGVITDAGGVLSHCSIVAREYRIPAVVGTGNATHILRDGQVVEINGSQGTIRLLD